MHSQIVYALTAGRNLYPYIRLGPRYLGTYTILSQFSFDPILLQEP